MNDYLDIVRDQIAGQYRDFNHDKSTDSVWTETKSNVFHLADQFKIAGKFDRAGAQRIVNVYNQEINKLGGPTVSIDEIWPE